MTAQGQTRADSLLLVDDLKKYFPVKKGLFKRVVGHVKALDGVTMDMAAGETMGLVGESGCGKTTFGRTVSRLLHPTGGRIRFRMGDGYQDVTTLKERDLKAYRRQVQLVFQDPHSSLNPRMLVGDIIGEPLLVNGVKGRRQREDAVVRRLETVGLNGDYRRRYPHEFSGGQRQRISIARALILNPSMIICDEAVSALDVSVQAQILNLFLDLQEEFALTYLFITHDLSVVQHVSDRITVMYLGKVVEQAPTETIFREAIHPYTQFLLSAIPIPDPDAKKEAAQMDGAVPDPANPPSGCAFHPRCLFASERCVTEQPYLVEAGSDHYVACHFLLDAE